MIWGAFWGDSGVILEGFWFNWAPFGKPWTLKSVPFGGAAGQPLLWHPFWQLFWLQFELHWPLLGSFWAQKGPYRAPKGPYRALWDPLGPYRVHL